MRNMNYLEKNMNVVDAPKNVSYMPQVEIMGRNGVLRAYDPISYLATKRVVLLDGEITYGVANVINTQLLMLEKQDPNKPIYLYINSPGGSVTEGRAIFDTMCNIKCEVHTIGYGMCASMGSFLLSAGILTGSASVLPETTVMVHQVLGGCQGQSTDMDIHTDFAANLKARLNAYYVQFIAKAKGYDFENPEDAEKIDKIIDFVDAEWERDWYLSAEEAVQYGLVNKILYTKETKKANELIAPIEEKFKKRREERKKRGFQI